MINKETTIPNTAATTILSLAKRISRFLRRNQAEIPNTKTEATTYPDNTVCRNLFIAIGEKSTSQKFVISLRAVSGLKCMPTGYCIHEFATRIHRAERFAPIAVSQVESK